jgi:hypothetical protein
LGISFINQGKGKQEKGENKPPRKRERRKPRVLIFGKIKGFGYLKGRFRVFKGKISFSCL